MSSDVTQSAGFYDFLAWLEVNKKRVVTVVTGVAVLAFVISLVVYQKKQREITANAALLKLGLPLTQAENATPPSAKDYEKIAVSFSGTSAGERALLLSAGALFSENQYAEALNQFKKFQSAHSDSRLAPIAHIGVAACLEAQNKIDEALTAYKDVTSRFSMDSVSGQAKLALARIYEGKNQPEQALKMYDDLLGATSRSGWSAEAGDLKEQLLVKYPKLATNAPPSIPAKTISSVMDSLKTNAITNAVKSVVTSNATAKPAASTNAVKKP